MLPLHLAQGNTGKHNLKKENKTPLKFFHMATAFNLPPQYKVTLCPSLLWLLQSYFLRTDS